jgi:hypothetical protein
MSKKGVKKTKTKRSKFKPSRRSAPRTDIGMVSTIPFAPHSTYRDAFELGLGSSVANAGVLDNLGYDQNRLDTALGNLDGNNGIHLIVTLGGLHPALRAAAVVSRTPFVFAGWEHDGSELDRRAAVLGCCGLAECTLRSNPYI